MKSTNRSALKPARVVVMTGRRKSGCCCLWLLVVLTLSANAEVKLTAGVERSTVPLDGTVNYTLTLSGLDMNTTPSLPTPQLTNLRIVGQSQSSNILIVNNRTDISSSVSYTLQPLQLGGAAIGAVEMVFGGVNYRTEPITIKVTKATGRRASTPAPTSQSTRAPISLWEDFDEFFARPFFSVAPQPVVADPILAETSVSQTRAFVNQLVLLTFTFYRRVNLLEAPNYIPPATTGFWAVNLPPSGRQRQVVVKGIPYLAQDFTTALFPTMAGQVTIGPATLTARINPFSGPITIKTKAITLAVQPLSEADKPAEFSGAVGQYTLATRLDKSTSERGQPFKLIAVVSGVGNIETVSEPKLKLGESIKLINSTADTKIVKSARAVSGRKTFSFTLIPLEAGKQSIEPLGFCYFDPTTKKYVTVKSPPLAINILPSNVPLPPSVVAAKTKAKSQVVELSLDWKKLIKKIINIMTNQYFIWVVLISGVLLGGWFGLKLYWDRQLADPVKLKQKQANRLARRQLKKAQTLWRAGRTKEYLAELWSAVAYYLGSKYAFPVLGLTADQIREDLLSRGLDEQTWTVIDKFFSACDLLRFTPTLTDKAEAEKLLKNAQKIIVDLEIKK